MKEIKDKNNIGSVNYVADAISKFNEIFSEQNVELQPGPIIQYYKENSLIFVKTVYLQFFIKESYMNEFILKLDDKEPITDTIARVIVRLNINETGTEFDGVEVIFQTLPEIWRYTSNYKFLDKYIRDGNSYRRLNKPDYYYYQFLYEEIETELQTIFVEKNIPKEEKDSISEFLGNIKTSIPSPWYIVAFKMDGTGGRTNHSIYPVLI